ncbi:putative toxin-antitoxin system toxin component, PIN family [Pseudorhodoferax sp. Leaf274]|uniref:putative toxin-antitoxin system toxin component, PIN family n=1 Tax=Pseudorhodoferax sp. Leaf274 TaxID=1736318 RepID=UPI0009E9B82E|nr:putative toxin-antitoxin system toxin component, PIN family [Pseudorhodoferax sp. Leaf274]
MRPADASRAVVLDTNVALDLLLFQDPGTAALQEALQQGRLRWLVLPGMRAEFVRVLDYPHLLAWRQAHGRSAKAALAAFDAHSCTVEPVPACAVRCSDPDDQPFIDLAVAHRALLLSKDRAVLATRAPLAGLGVRVEKQLLTNRHPPLTRHGVEAAAELAHLQHM